MPTSAVTRGVGRCASGCATTTTRAYYTGIVYERRAKARLRHGTPGCGPRVYEWLREAMSWYEKAEADPRRRQRRCAAAVECVRRLIMRDRHLVPAIEERGEPLLLE